MGLTKKIPAKGEGIFPIKPRLKRFLGKKGIPRICDAFRASTGRETLGTPDGCDGEKIGEKFKKIFGKRGPNIGLVCPGWHETFWGK